jgi:hypothetical protein
MEILRDKDVGPAPDLRFYRETSWSALVVSIVMLAVVCAVAGVLTVNDAWTATWAIVAFAIWAAIMALAILLYFRTFRASRRPQSWRLAWTPNRLYLRFRSFQNFRFDPETPSVVALAGRDIDWIRSHARTQEAQGRHGNWNTRYKTKGLQIKLRSVADTAPLSDALKAEAVRRDPKGTRYIHTPVTLDADSVLHVEIGRPAPLLKQLRLYYTVTQEATTPMTRFRDMPTDAKERHILELALAGRKIDAIKAAREVYGDGLAEAKHRVEELMES